MKSPLIKMLNKTVNQAFNAVGLELVQKARARTWEGRMRHAKKLGFAPQIIIDGGGFRGLWSKDIANLFPAAEIIIVEPNPFVQDIIAKNVSHVRPLPKILPVALGESQGKSLFNIWRDVGSDTGASLLNHVSGKPERQIEVEVDTLDNIAQRLCVVPNLIKLDLQGGELKALKGGLKVLRNAELAVIEFGCLNAYIDRATPRDIIDIMYDHDFCLYDVVDCADRPYDGALCGGDFFFVKNSSILKNYQGWE